MKKRDLTDAQLKASADSAKPTRFERQLLACMNAGIRIVDQDGHRWIVCDDEAGSWVFKALKEAGINLNGKIYGSYREAVAVINDALHLAQKPRIESAYIGDEEYVFCESGGLEDRANRISTTFPGNGGIT